MKSILKFYTNLALIVGIFFIYYIPLNVFAQLNCDLSSFQYNAPTTTQAITCDNSLSNTNPVYINKFRLLNSSPEFIGIPKTIEIAIHVFVGTGTYQNTSGDIASINQIIAYLNSIFQNSLPSDPIPGVPYVSPTNISFELDNRIYFYSGTNLWNSCNDNSMMQYIQNNNSSSLKYLPILLNAGGCVQHAVTPYPAFIYSGITAGSLSGNQYMYASAGPGNTWVQAQVFAHELGHCLVSCIHTIRVVAMKFAIQLTLIFFMMFLIQVPIAGIRDHGHAIHTIPEIRVQIILWEEPIPICIFLLYKLLKCIEHV